MELIRGLHNLRERHRGCVLSIGNFDGVHRGHQALLARLRERAREHGVPAAVQMFEPTPREFFARTASAPGSGGTARGEGPGRIVTLRDKLERLEAEGVQRVLCVRFNRAFAAIEATAFIEHVLVEQLGVQAVVVGDDFRFGAGRRGDLRLLQALGRSYSFSAEAMHTVQVDGERVSSSAVRSALLAGDLARAERLLGRPYAVSGRVRRGLQLGRKLGMPTANVVLKQRPALQYGVYVIEASAGTRQWQGVASVGVRPTLGEMPCLLEAHLFGEAGELYGEILTVKFLAFLRREARFDSLDALAKQMQEDAAQARAWLKRVSMTR